MNYLISRQIEKIAAKEVKKVTKKDTKKKKKKKVEKKVVLPCPGSKIRSGGQGRGLGRGGGKGPLGIPILTKLRGE